MLNAEIARDCQVTLTRHLDGFPSLKESSKQIASRIIAQFADCDLSKMDFIHQVSKTTNEMLKLKEIYSSGDNDIEEKLKIQLLTVREMLEDARFSDVTIKSVLSAELGYKDLEDMCFCIRKSKLPQSEKKRKMSVLKILLGIMSDIKNLAYDKD